MKTSARNQLAGTIKTVTEGAVMSEVVVRARRRRGGGGRHHGRDRRAAWRLADGSRVAAIVKSTEVMIAVEGE